MSLFDSIREKTDPVSERTNGRFHIEVDELTREKPGNFEKYPLYSVYLFEQGYENPYPLFAMDSKTGEDYPAEMRIADERGLEPIQINSLDELRSNLDTILQDDFLDEHVRVVYRRPQFERRK